MTLLYDDLEYFKRQLEAKRADLASRHDPEGIAIERSADSMDAVLLANERDLNVERLNRETRLLRQVAEALGRLATKEFGICLECGEPIPAKRLMALPWAALCLQCQEAADRAPLEEGTETRREDGSIMEAA